MATALQSPGVNVSVNDLSFYTPSAPGTVPTIFVASAANKLNSSGVIAKGTIPQETGQATVWTITSQLDLANTFGTPLFRTDSSGNPIHAGEQNEYGLQAAYSYLGASSKAYVIRANVDLSELTAQASVPEGLPIDGTYWLDTSITEFGITEWDADNKVFVNQMPFIIDDSNVSTDTADGMTPLPSIGTLGEYAIVTTSENMGLLWYKNQSGKWVQVGSNTESHFGSSITGSSFTSTSWQSSYPLVTSTGFVGGLYGGNTFYINSTLVTIASTSTSAVATSINALLPQHGVGAKVNSSGKLELYADITADGVTTNDGKIVLSGTTATITALGLTAGTYAPPQLVLAPHTQIPKFASLGAPSGSVYVKTTSPGLGANWIVKLYDSNTAKWNTIAAKIYGTTSAAIAGLDPVGGGSKIPTGTLMIQSNYDSGTGASGSPRLAEFQILRRSAVSPTTIIGNVNASSITITRGASASTTTYAVTIAETVAGNAVAQNSTTLTLATLQPSGGSTSTTISGASVVQLINNAGFQNVSASIDSSGYISIVHGTGGDMLITGDTSLLSTVGFTDMGLMPTDNLYPAGMYDSYTFLASNWKPLVFEAIPYSPSTTPANGTMWYGSNLEDVDILYHNGTTWVGYHYQGHVGSLQGVDSAFPNSDPNGPIVSASQPTKQSDGTDLVDGDIWIDSSATHAYGQSVYVYNGSTLSWVKQDVTDHITSSGWVFHDARWATNGQATQPSSIKELLASNYLDPDAPDPALYPEGTRLWNTRRSGFNIKQYKKGYINIYDNSGLNARYQNDQMDGIVPYNADRWVSVSPNDYLGVGTFGRQAQRGVVVAAIKAEIDTNQSIRDTDTTIFNLLAAPGYPEAVQNLIALNSDRGYTGFVVGDTPFRLPSDGTSLSNWGYNKANAVDNNEQGVVSADDYMAMFYPSGYTNDNTGNPIVVPPSHMMLRTIANNDQIAYQWFAPAGVNRGAILNATSVGYVDAAGDFIPAPLPQSIRDVMAKIKINPIATLNGAGIVNFGNYTRPPGNTASALDRINVARLVAYLRYQLNILAHPYLFEPNDSGTRHAIKNAAESLMIELVGQRAIYDYIVVCDEQNNTPARIDRSELWLDIAIEPTKAVEFIYIPLRLLNTGAIASGNLGAGFPGSTK
jgi:hypothetical protein